MTKSSGRRTIAETAVITGLAVLMVAFWGSCIFGNDIPVAGVYQDHFLPYAADGPPELSRQWDSLLYDSVAQFYPWRLLAHRSFTEYGEFPLWNPYQLCGTPFVGNGQSALFYPPHWILALTDTGTAMGIINALHYFLAALFVFLLIRILGGHIAAAALGAVIYAFGGFMVTWVELPSLVETATWIPAGLLGMELLFRGRPWRGGLLTAAALGLSLLAGHFQIAAYVWLVTLASAAVHCIFWAGNAIRKRKFRPYRRAAIGLIIAVAVGVGAGAIQLLPTLELGANSPRGAGAVSVQGYEFHRQRSLAPIELVTMVDPDFLGTPVEGNYPGISYSEHCAYIGIVGFIGILLAVLVGRHNRHIWLFAGIGGLALWTALGGLPSYAYYFWIPKIGLAGGFSRLLSVFTCAGAVLAGLGYTRLIELLSENQRKWAGGLVWILGLAALMQAVPWAYQFNPRTPADELYEDTRLVRKLQSLDGRVLAITDPQDWTLAELPEALLPPNSGIVYGYESVNGYDSLFTATYRRYANDIQNGIASPASNGNMVLISRPFSAMNAACEYYVTKRPLPLEMMDLEPGRVDEVYTGPGGYIYKDRAAAPYAGMTTEVLLEPNENPPIAAGRVGMNRIDLLDYPDASARIAEGYYPGWLGLAAGRAMEIRRTDGTFMSYPGYVRTDTVHLIYYPASVALGGFITLVAIALAAALLTARYTLKSRFDTAGTGHRKHLVD